MNIKGLLIFALMLFSTFVFCQNNHFWESKYHELNFSYSDDFYLVNPRLDDNKKLLLALKDSVDNSSIIIRIKEDISKEIVSDESYYETVKNQMLSANSNNKLILEKDTIFKEKEFHLLIFEMQIKFGNFYHSVYINRDGDKIYIFQISFPQLDDNYLKFPKKINYIIESLKI